MGKALYRKYRSKSLDEIVGQPHITTTLGNALKKGEFSHAYLFTGPRGTGKTSIARILAHEVNGLPYQEDSTHLDIIEIDAASNRRIDEIRELRERVHTAPTSAKYKVYIIDEVHMLTREAFNALLKTLEEPPAHVIFILATTEAHKLPETIISRTQRFTFKPVASEAVIGHLQHIAKEEGLDISDEALALVAGHGGGSFRDSISLLDQVRNHGDTVGLADVQAMLGIAPETAIRELYDIVASGQPSQLIELLNTMQQNGYQTGQVAKQLSSLLRSELLSGVTQLESSNVAALLQKLLDIPTSADPQTSLELVLLDIILARAPLAQSSPAPKATTETIPEPKPAGKPEKKLEVEAKPIKAAKEEKPTPKPAPRQQSTVGDIAIWSEALDSLKKTHNTLYSVARMAEATVEADEVTLVFRFPFHKRRLDETKNKQIITDILHQLAGRPITMTCILANGQEKTAALATPAPADTISTISNIFGSAEVLD